jgi:hypothetical protein
MSLAQIDEIKARIKPFTEEISANVKTVVDKAELLCLDDLLIAYSNISAANKEILKIIQEIPNTRIDLKIKLLKLNTLIQKKVSDQLDKMLDDKLAETN